MSHDFDNFDMMAERTIWPWIDDASRDTDDIYTACWAEIGEQMCEAFDDSFVDSMDGDFDSAMRDAGFGTDEDYGDFGGEDY